jgi:hypothetical protein
MSHINPLHIPFFKILCNITSHTPRYATCSGQNFMVILLSHFAQLILHDLIVIIVVFLRV